MYFPISLARKSVSIMTLHYDINTVVPYVNWDYFFYAWGMQRKPEAERQMLRQEAEEVLADLQGRYQTHAIFLLADAYSEGDDVIVLNGEGTEAKAMRIPFLRQQQPGSECLCLADFIRPQNLIPSALRPSPPTSPIPPASSQIGIFATTVDGTMETDFARDEYMKMMVQLLADRLAEATAERMHEEVRKRYWGYAPDERLTMQQLHTEQFQGIRPAVGYPSLPDTSLNFIIDTLLDLRQIGIRLTESGAMKPHASVSGLMIATPQAHYFNLGKIGEDQLRDYARRRGLPLEVMRKFLLSNL